MLKHIVLNAIREVVSELYGIHEVELSLPRDVQVMDYACPIAMKVAKLQGKVPFDVATEIVRHLQQKAPFLSAEVAVPGFINIRVSAEMLFEHARAEDFLTPLSEGNNDLVMIEYASLNMGKPATIGHLLNMIHGEAMKRILRWYGYRVHAVDHVGDWGTQFAKMLVALHKWGNREEVEADPIPTLVKLYVRFHDEAEKDPTLEDEARSVFTKLEQGDPELKKEWQWIVTLNMEENMKFYEELGVSFDSQVGESFYVPMVPQMITFMLERGIAEQNEDGSVAVVFEKHGIDLPSCLLAKRDGSSLYHARDLATAKYRRETFHPKKIIHVVGDEQFLYFRQLIAMLSLLGWTEETTWIHMAFGLFSLKDGKISTRKGRVIYGHELLQEGKERAYQLLKERGLEKNPEIDMDELAEVLALGSIYYANLSQNRTTSQIFDWDKALSFEGNSAPYLQYVHARAASVLRKATDLGVVAAMPKNSYVMEASERALLLKLLQFPEAVESCVSDLRSNLLALYLFELSSVFNQFYTQCSILQESDMEKTSFRVHLVGLAKQVMAQGLDLLNIGAPERM